MNYKDKIRRKKNKKERSVQHVKRRQAYQLKRRKEKYKKSKKKGVVIVGNIYKRREQIRKTPKFVQHSAPKKFSFIHYTNDIIRYFIEAEQYISNKRMVFFDISRVTSLTIDAITLQAAYLADQFKGYAGNSPERKELQQLFENSGFYNYVKSSGKKEIDPNNKLFRFAKEDVPNRRFAASIADSASEFCYDISSENFGMNEIQFRDEVYNILLEAMSNTNHHASIKRGEKKWHAFMQRNIFTGVFSVCLIDLGKGIFESANFKQYKRVLSYLYKGNYSLIDDFLDGKIYSSVTNDETRGKGIRQILNCAQRKEFKCIWIITNDVKFEIKTRTKERLNYPFNGTCIYFEIEKNF